MNTFFRFFAVFFAISLVSCDKDYNNIGSDIIGDQHFNFAKYDVEYLESNLKASNSVQSNNLPINSLGIYNNPVFGTTKAHVVTQLELINLDPDLGNQHEITAKDSVYIYIPFFYKSNETVTDANGNRTFKLDSIYGDLTQEFKLNIYENKYYLNNLDPNDNFESTQKYYSNFKSVIDNVRDNSPLYSVSPFKFSSEEYVIYKTNSDYKFVNSSGAVTEDPTQYVVKERKTPGLWLNLDKAKIKERILDAVANGKLVDNNTFKQYFRGLLFEVEELQANKGAMAMLDFTKAEVVLQYRSYDVAADGTQAATKTKKTMNLRMGYSVSGANKANTVNLFEFSNINSDYSTALNGGSNPERLYLKGGANGSVAYIDLFTGPDIYRYDENGVKTFVSNGVPDELDDLRKNNWLINDAFLTFYVDQAKMSPDGIKEPLRILLFDADNNTLITDYYADATTLSNTKYNKYIHGGILQKDDNKKGLLYKIRISEYLKLLLANENDIQNIRLGLVVTENINFTTFNYLETPFIVGSDEITRLPQGAVVNPIGTVLHGTGSTDTAKKLKLEIYYTEPN